MRYQFGDYTLDTQQQELYRAGETLALGAKVFAVLVYLVRHRHRVVPRHELLAHVWGQQHISPTTFDSCLLEVRRAVGDSGHVQEIIRTRRGVGYRFVAPVQVLDPVAAADLHESPQGPERSSLSMALHRRTAPVPPVVGPASATRLQPVLSGEYKQVTVFAGALDESGTLANSADPERTYFRRQTGLDMALEVILQYGGVVLGVVEGEFLALFGAPVGHEDHALRAAQAALELHHRCRYAQSCSAQVDSFPLAVRIGLHTGPVVVAPLGATQHLNVTSVGDTLPLATQLQHFATPGETLASAATVQHLHGRAHLGTVAPAGSLCPANSSGAFRVLHIGPRHLPSQKPWSRFVGRTWEMETLYTCWRLARDGQGQIAHLMGEPGMGKSRLLYEFRRGLQGEPGQYAAGKCISYGQTIPSLPLVALLRSLCGLTETDSLDTSAATLVRCLQALGLDADSLAPYLLHLLGLPGETPSLATASPQAIRRQTFAALLQFCVHSSWQHPPLVIEMEDVHWIDATSEAWLTACVEQVASAPILLLITFRPGYAPPWMDRAMVTQVGLQPLDSHDSHIILRDTLAQTTVAEAIFQSILRKAQGNPFFLEELARTVTESPDQELRRLPDTVQAVLAARIDRLAPAAKHLLQVAAVVGKEVPLAVLRACTDLPAEAVQQSIAQLQATEFLYETFQATTPAYTFKHILTQEVAYQSLLQHTRQRYHERIAQVLLAQFPDVAAQQPVLVAHHYTAAGRIAAAVPHWQHAGEQARARSADIEAVAHFTRGLELLLTLPETPARDQQDLALQLALGPALMATKGYAAAVVRHTYERARQLCQRSLETPQRFQALYGLWVFYFVRGECQIALTLAQQLLALAQDSQHPEYLLHAQHALGSIYHHLGDLQRSHAYLTQSIALDLPQGQPSLVWLSGQDPQAGCLIYDALALWSLGYPAQALQRCSQALSQVRALAHPYSLVFVQCVAAVLHSLRGEVEAVQHYAAAAMALATAQEFVYWRAQAEILHGWALLRQGQERGLAQMRQGLAARQATGARLALPYNLTLMAEACHDAGYVQEGWNTLQEAFAVVASTGEDWGKAELSRLQGTFLYHQGPQHWPEAEQCCLQALAIAQGQQAKSLELRAAMSLARWWDQRGQRPAAYRMLAAIYGRFTEGFDTVELQEAAALLGTFNSECC